MSREVVLDRVGAALVAASIAWALALSIVRGGDPSGQVVLLLALAAVVAAVRVLSASGRPVGPMAVAAAGAVLLLASIGAHTRGAGLPFGLPIGPPKTSAPPLIYPNANGAFFVQAAAASLILAAARVGRGLRWAGIAAAVVFGAAAVLSGSLAASLTLVIVAAALVVPGGRVGSRLMMAAAAAAVVAVLVTTIAIASSDPGRGRGRGLGRAERVVANRLGGIRIDLWREAFALTRENPVGGVGPGRFGRGTDSPRRDRDQLWAHNEFLQQGAESGIPGFLLLVALVGWGFVRLWFSPADRITGLAAASLAALAVHASVDYVVHFPLVPLAAAALVGTAQAPRRGREVAPAPGVRRAVKAAVLPAGLFRPRRDDDVAILLYHRVGAGNREIDLSTEAFDEQMAELAAHHRVLRLDDLVDGRRAGGVLVTFDDGQRDFHANVLPVLVRHDIPAVLYLATSWVGSPRVRDALSWKQIEEAVATGLVEIGSHTHRHLDLSDATEREAEEEMRRSRELVEDRLGRPCRHFAYPWGVGSEGADRAARRLFDTAVLAWGTNRDGFDRYRLGRLPVLRSDGRFFFRAKVRGMLDGEAWVYRAAGRGPWRRS